MQSRPEDTGHKNPRLTDMNASAQATARALADERGESEDRKTAPSRKEMERYEARARQQKDYRDAKGPTS